MKDNLLLMDGDLFAYRHSAAAEKATDWGDGQWTLHADFDTAADNMLAEIKELTEKLEGAKVIVCLSDDDVSWRREKVFPDYKRHRAPVRKPMILAQMKQRLRDTYDVKTKPTLEADDVMGIIATNPKLYPTFEKVIVSRDKDMKTIPGMLWHDNRLKAITVKEAERFHMVQTLMGDKSDGYPGCPGIGEVRAERITDPTDPSDMWARVVAAYVKAGKTEEDALVNARCARILRHQDWNYATQEPILWTPTPST